MFKVVIIVNAEVRLGKVSPTAPVAAKMVDFLYKEISNSDNSIEVKIIGAADLWAKSVNLNSDNDNLIYCPLTIKLPDWVDFPAKKIFELCIDIQGRRNWVAEKFKYKTTINNSWLGNLWLPIILTEKGPIYGEVIGEGEIPNSYQQPIDFSDNIRQLLYQLGYELLESINAIPAVYLLQFRMLDNQIIFDRLWPFPATPAIASVKCQKPDLFACHWFCLTGKPIIELRIEN